MGTIESNGNKFAEQRFNALSGVKARVCKVISKIGRVNYVLVPIIRPRFNH